jgi:hypothetical protein
LAFSQPASWGSHLECLSINRNALLSEFAERISSLELTATQIAAKIYASQSSSNRHLSTSTVQRRLCESILHGRNDARKPLLKNTNNKKRLAWAKKHEQWTLDWCKFVLLSDASKCDIFGSNHHITE